MTTPTSSADFQSPVQQPAAGLQPPPLVHNIATAVLGEQDTVHHLSEHFAHGYVTPPPGSPRALSPIQGVVGPILGTPHNQEETQEGPNIAVNLFATPQPPAGGAPNGQDAATP